MWSQLPRILVIGVASFALAACGGDGGSGGRTAPPANLSYASPVQGTAEEALVPLMPTVTGSVASYSVSPALPAGLTISPVTGVISGTPATASAATTFTITASNSAGSTSFLWQLTVLPPPPVTANAGTPQSVSAGSFVTLDGSASRTRVGGSPAYEWQLTSMPSGSAATLASPSSVKPIFLADLVGTYTASLIVGDGAYRSSASNVSVTVTAPERRVPPPTAANSVPVSQCQEITNPGNYLLTRDLSAPAGEYECIRIHDTTDVVLDCGNHMLSGGIPDGQYVIRSLSIRNVQGFSVIKCRLHVEWLPVDDSENGIFTDNAFTNAERDVKQAHVVFLRDRNMVVAHNTFTGVSVSQNFGDNMTVSNNRFVLAPGVAYINNSSVDSHYATRTQIVGNVMDGGWHGPQTSWYGADNGILLGDATDALVQNNTIANVWGAAIEWTGTLRSSTIAANYIVNAGGGGLGAWYWNSAAGSRFQQNIVDDSPLLFTFYRIYGLRAFGDECPPLYCVPPGSWPADTAVMFRDNLFDGNVLRNVKPGAVAAGWLPVFNQLGYLGSVSDHIGERVPTAEEFEFVNNTFRNNVFDTTLDAPLFGYDPVVPGMIIDGGFNVCRQPATPDYPLKCIF